MKSSTEMEGRSHCRQPLCLRNCNYMILLVLIPLLYILTVDEREVFETRDFVEDNKTWNAAERAIMNLSYWNSSLYEGINLMDLPPYQFDPKYKNPCWREGGQLRCLPYFFINGCMKSGTSELWKYVSSHPDFAQPKFKKESQWFSNGRFEPGKESIDYFINLFAPAARKIDNSSEELQQRLITGEASPANLHKNCHWRHLPGNENLDEPKYVILDYIRHIQPNAKVLLIFRDPVDRLYSDYFHRFGRHKSNNPSPEKFHDLIVEGINTYTECFASRTIRACVYDERLYRPLIINMQLGLYHVYWEELTRLFPRENILTLQNQDLIDIEAFFKPVFKFLGLSPIKFGSKMTKKVKNRRNVNDRAAGDMLNKTRKLLVEFYKPHNEKMYRLTGDPAFLYHESV